MSVPRLSLATFGVVTASFAIAYARYLEYRREVQRDIYMTIVGTEYKFEYNDESHTLEVVNVDVGGGRLPTHWGTIIAVEFDIEVFPWPPQNPDERSEMDKDLEHEIEWFDNETPEIVDIQFINTQRRPGLMVTVPTTDIFLIKEVLRRLPQSTETVFQHYNREKVDESLRKVREQILEASVAQARAFERGKKRLENYR